MTGYKNLYDQLLKSGELFDVFPTALGVWEEDRAEFTQLQDELEYLTDTPLILDEEDEEDEEEQEDFY